VKLDDLSTEKVLKGVAGSAGLRVVVGLYAALIFFYAKPGFLVSLALLATPFSLLMVWKEYGSPFVDLARGVVFPWLTFGFMLGAARLVGRVWSALLVFGVFMGYRAYVYWHVVKNYKALGRMVRKDFQRSDNDE